MCVSVLLVVQKWTLAGTIICRVALGSNDEVPLEAVEVNLQWVSAASRLIGVLVTVQAQTPLGAASGGVPETQLQVWLLVNRKTKTQ